MLSTSAEANEHPGNSHECDNPWVRQSGGVAVGLSGIARCPVRNISGVMVPDDCDDTDPEEYLGESRTCRERFSSSDAGVIGYAMSAQFERS